MKNSCQRRGARRAAFTLIEVLVVVAIIALLIAILIPSLSRARETARTTKCLTNMMNLSKGVLTFSITHRGFGQLIGREDEWTSIDPGGAKYAYEPNAFGQATPQLLPWPVAYAKEIGERSLKRMEDYFVDGNSFDPNRDFYLSRFGRHEVFMCPSDTYGVTNAWSPFEMYGLNSYAANEDVFGVTNPLDGEGKPWKDGVREGGRRLEGKMERIIRPSEVALFCDGGNESWKTRGDLVNRPSLLITNGTVNGPYLENYEKFWQRLPHFRHSARGGMAVAFADGSGTFSKPLEWSGSYVKRYSPRVRVSPFNVGTLQAAQP